MEEFRLLNRNNTFPNMNNMFSTTFENNISLIMVRFTETKPLSYKLYMYDGSSFMYLSLPWLHEHITNDLPYCYVISGEYVILELLRRKWNQSFKASVTTGRTCVVVIRVLRVLPVVASVAGRSVENRVEVIESAT